MCKSQMATKDYTEWLSNLKANDEVFVINTEDEDEICIRKIFKVLKNKIVLDTFGIINIDKKTGIEIHEYPEYKILPVTDDLVSKQETILLKQQILNQLNNCVSIEKLNQIKDILCY